MGGQLDRAARAVNRAGEVRQYYHARPDGSFTIRTFQDVEPHLEHAARLRREERENRGAFGKRNDWHHTMSVPHNVIYAVAAKLGIENKDIFGKEEQKRINAELKKPEFKLFRVTNDKLIGK